MKKRIFGKKLSRSRTARMALYRSLTRALFENQSIVTTLAKAKAVQVYIEKIISIAKKDSLTSRRRLLAKLANNKRTTKDILNFCKNTKRNSGFTRIVLLPSRRGDNAKMARLELVDRVEEKKKETKIKGKKSKKKSDSKAKDSLKVSKKKNAKKIKEKVKKVKKGK